MHLIAECISNYVDVVALFWRVLFFNDWSRYQRYHNPSIIHSESDHSKGRYMKSFWRSEIFRIWLVFSSCSEAQPQAQSTTRRRVGRPIGFALGLGIAKVYAEHGQFGSFNGVHQTSFFHSYATEIKSIQLYDSIVMASPWFTRTSVTLNYNVKRTIDSTEGSWNHRHFIFGNCLHKLQYKLRPTSLND